MLKYIYISLFLGLSFLSQAQNEPPAEVLKAIPDYRFNLSYAWSPTDAVRHVELGLNKDIINLRENKLRLGLGVRMGIQDNQNISFTTAHPTLKSSDATIDTLFNDRVLSVAFNFYANGEYFLLKNLSVGINLDLLGVSTGGDSKAFYRPGAHSKANGFIAESGITSFPTKANAFSSGNSKGSLNSQLYVRYEPFRRVGIRAGFAYLFQEFSTEQTLGSNSAYRYENNGMAFFVGITFNRIQEK